MVNQDIIVNEPQVFDFRKHWNKQCRPHLFKKKVLKALDSGMYHIEEVWIMECEEKGFSSDLVPRWDVVKMPRKMSNWRIKGKPPKPYTLNWYRPWGFCWGIAPFCRELGKCIYPELRWRIVRGAEHTIAVGFKDDEPYMIFDILNFDTMSAREILDLAGYKESNKKSRNTMEMDRLSDYRSELDIECKPEWLKLSDGDRIVVRVPKKASTRIINYIYELFKKTDFDGRVDVALKQKYPELSNEEIKRILYLFDMTLPS